MTMAGHQNKINHIYWTVTDVILLSYDVSVWDSNMLWINQIFVKSMVPKLSRAVIVFKFLIVSITDIRPDKGNYETNSYVVNHSL